MAAIDSYSPQASVIGAILLEPKLMGEAMMVLSADDFQAPNCKIAWQALTRIFREGKTVDVVLLRDALTGFDGVTAFLASCMEAAPFAGNFPAHCAALKKQAMLARMKDFGARLAEASDLDEAMQLLGEANAASIQRGARSRRTMAQMFQSFAERHAATVIPDYLPWPLKPLNEGVKVGPGKFVVIGGYPSDGKTAFALQAATAQAEKSKRVALYSFETDENTVEDRELAAIAGISLERIQTNQLLSDDWSRYAMASEKAGITFDCINAAEMSVDDIRADALAHRYDVIYIDYLQLIRPTRRNNQFSRFDEVSEISRGLQQLAKTTGITVVALSQLSRPAADKKGNIPAPTMHNLRESGQIEQDADVIMLIYRMNHKNIRAPRFLDVVKNKEGRTGHFELVFDGIHQRFSEQTQNPYPRTPPTKTPVLADQQEPEQFSLLTDADSKCPF